MKKNLIILVLVFVIARLYGQEYYVIDFEGEAATIDGIYVENLTQETSVELEGTNVLHLLLESTYISNMEMVSKNLTIFPNPMKQLTNIEFFNSKEGNVNIVIYSITGQQIYNYSSNLSKGIHIFSLHGVAADSYVISVKTEADYFTGKFVSLNKTESYPVLSQNYEVGISNKIEKSDPILRNKIEDKGIKSHVEMNFDIGDQLKFIGYAEGFVNDTIYDSPIGDQTYTFVFESSIGEPCSGILEVTDIDGNTYPTVIIEDQCWLAENLRTTKYNDNTEIENLTLSDDWMNATEGAYVWFDNDIDNKETYGALYNFFAVTSGKLCPDGWRVATDNDWKILEGNHDSELHPESSEWDNESWRGTDAGYNLKSTDGWIGMGNGDDIYGFTALPGGQRNAMDGEFERAGEWGTWWSDKNEEENETYRRYINHENQNIARFNSNPRSGYSVRCIKN